MRFSQFTKYLQKLEETPKRLEITNILTELISELDVGETPHAMYLSRGYLTAEYKSTKFNIAEKMMLKVLATAYDIPEKEVNNKYSKLGDLGTVAYELNKTDIVFGESIEEIHKQLMEIALTEGSGSQDRKINLTAQLLKKADKPSAKYITRIVLGTTRLGFTELTIIDGLVQFLVGKKDKETKKIIEAKYRIHPDIGLVAQKIKQKELAGLDDIEMEVGIPVHAQKAQRLSNPQEIIEKLGTVWAEYKFDGTRVQLHLDRNKRMEVEDFEQQDLFNVSGEMILIKTFTRNLEETTHQFPDIVEAADKQVNAESVILDGEAIGYNKTTGEFLPFQETIQRKRKHDISETAKLIPLKYLVFDILFLNGKSLVNEPLLKRREILNKVIKKGEVVEVDYHMETSSPEELAEFSKEALSKGLEGIMAKKPDSPYEAGARNYSWVKLKKSEEQILDDTVDCVVLGYYFGRGVRANFGIGGFLVGIWDENDNMFKTITKVGTGLKDDEWKKLKEMCDAIAIKEKPENAEIDKKYNCDVWTKPEIVVELAADELSKSSEHSAKYALRFPRLVKFRTDKSSKDTTSPEEIADLYKRQNQN